MAITATQELYDAIYFNLEKLGYVVYETLPPENVSYPFVVMGEIQKQSSNYKTAIGVTVNINIDVWGDSESRFSVDTMMNEIDSVTSVTTNHYEFIKRINESDAQLLHDNSTDKDLLHGILNLTFQMNRKDN